MCLREGGREREVEAILCRNHVHMRTHAPDLQHLSRRRQSFLICVLIRALLYVRIVSFYRNWRVDANAKRPHTTHSPRADATHRLPSIPPIHVHTLTGHLPPAARTHTHTHTAQVETEPCTPLSNRVCVPAGRTVGADGKVVPPPKYGDWHDTFLPAPK